MTLKSYKSKKLIGAAQITGIADDGTIELGQGNTFQPTPDWTAKHSPVVGGYLVDKGDGYVSFWASDLFESNYEFVEIGQ